MSSGVRVGIGYDVHAVVSDRPLRLGGLSIDAPFGLGGHTDGDVVIHALIDALFGAAGLPDIGECFSDQDPALHGRDSRELMVEAVGRVSRSGYEVNNADLTIIAEAPRLSAYKGRMRASLAELLQVRETQVSVKAKTHEGLDAVGQGQAIACHAIVSLQETE